MPGMELEGLDRLERVLEAAGDAARQQAPDALYDVALEAFATSQRLCPVDTGSLRGSGHVDPPKKSDDSSEVVAGYGGASAPYAIYVHENLEARHDPPTAAKFLETPFQDAASDIGSRVAKALEARIGSAR